MILITDSKGMDNVISTYKKDNGVSCLSLYKLQNKYKSYNGFRKWLNKNKPMINNMYIVKNRFILWIIKKLLSL